MYNITNRNDMKNLKRKQQLQLRAKNESLAFQTLFGAKQKYGNLTSEIEERINEEVLVFQNLGLAEDLLNLKNLMEGVKLELGYEAEPSKGILAGSYVAYSLGIEPSNPELTGNDIEVKDLQTALPISLTIRYDNEIRNKVVDWMKAQGYEFTTYMSQPMLKLKNARVIIRRVVKDAEPVKPLEGAMKEQVYETMRKLYTETSDEGKND